MQRRTAIAVLLSACLVIGSATLAAAARPDNPSVACPEGGGATLSLTIWRAGTHDGTGSTWIRRMRVTNQCAEFELVWFAADPAVGVTSSLLVAPGANGTLTDAQLAALHWDAVNTTWQLWIDAEPGALGDHSYCDFFTGVQTVPNPQWEMVPSGSLVPFSCV
jgi:hypothetical protein